jgi:hypothetical protein
MPKRLIWISAVSALVCLLAIISYAYWRVTELSAANDSCELFAWHKAALENRHFADTDDIVGCLIMKGFSPKDHELGDMRCKNGYLYNKTPNGWEQAHVVIDSCWHKKSLNFSPSWR